MSKFLCVVKNATHESDYAVSITNVQRIGHRSAHTYDVLVIILKYNHCM